MPQIYFFYFNIVSTKKSGKATILLWKPVWIILFQMNIDMQKGLSAQVVHVQETELYTAWQKVTNE